MNKLWELGLTRALGRRGYKALAQNAIYIAFGRGLTFAWVGFTLFWFWGDWSRIDKIFAALQPQQWALVWLAIWLCATVVLAVWTAEGPVLTSRYALVVYASALGLGAFVMTLLLNQPAPGVVYKAF